MTVLNQEAQVEPVPLLVLLFASVMETVTDGVVVITPSASISNISGRPSPTTLGRHTFSSKGCHVWMKGCPDLDIPGCPSCNSCRTDTLPSGGMTIRDPKIMQHS